VQTGWERIPLIKIISHLPNNMNYHFTTIVLVALAIINIIDGDFASPSWFDYIKFVLLAAALVLSIITERRRSNVEL